MQRSAAALGLYVSVPFCRAKCSFCNFASGVGSPEAVARYVSLLCSEIREARQVAAARGLDLPESADSVYFGGGTPSLLQPAQLRDVMTALRESFAVCAEAEITMEAAPGQIEDALLETAQELGVNRVSLGVQSFADREAQAVGRSHTEASCVAEFARLRRAGVENVGVDLIAGLPFQTEASWRQSLAVAVGSELQHASVYMFEVDEESRLGREVLGGGARLHAPEVPGDEAVAAMYEEACLTLPASGLAQYEISNFARDGRCSRHNRKYWTREPYVGFGLDAHSMVMGTDGAAWRWANPDELAAYDGRLRTGAAERVDGRAAFEETVFLRLRLLDGLREAELAVFPVAWRDEFADRAGLLVREGLMGTEPGRYWLTAKGRLVSSEVFGELLAGVAA